MRRGLVICVSAVLAACGGSGNDNAGGGGGGGGGGGATAVNVTGANTFTGSNAIGYSTPAPVTCTVSGLPVSTAIIAVFVTDVAGDVCALLNANQEKKGAGGIGLVITRGNVTTGTPSALAPGTYAITSSGSLPQQDAQGNITFASAFAAKNQPGTCGAADVEAESGTITITTVTGGVISGSIDASLKASAGGGKITGSFTTAACGLSTSNVCGSLVDDSPNACVD